MHALSVFVQLRLFVHSKGEEAEHHDQCNNHNQAQDHKSVTPPITTLLV